MVKLYVLGNKETGLHFSPFAWRAILSLKYKKIEYETEILGLSEVGPKVSEITEGKWKLVPLVVFDDGSYMYESFDIAAELEKRYPDAPSLFPNGLSNAKFHETYFMTQMLPVFKRIILMMLQCFSVPDREVFRKTREASFKCKLEDFAGDRQSQLKPADLAFDPLRSALKHAPFVEGEQPSFSDFIYFGGLQWVRITSPEDFELYVLKHSDPILKNWYKSIDRHFNGYPSEAKTAKDL